MNLQASLCKALTLLTPLLLTSVATAQGEEAAQESRSVIGEIFAWENAGPIGYLILLMSIVALALIIENFMNMKREKLAPPDLIDELEALFEEENFQEAAELCEQEENYLTKCVGAGLSKLGHAFETIQITIREMETEESVKLFQKIGWLSLMSAIAPMMGLFGTVSGMFVTFGKIADAGGSVSPATLAGGIKMALITTMLGLSVAIPVGVCFFILRGRVVRMSTEVNAIAEDLFERFRKGA
jgi:biopolymer transport protein ExbB